MTVIGIAALCALASVSQIAGTDSGNGKASIEIRTVAKSSDADYYAFPSVCRLRNGDLAAVFYCGTGHVSPNGQIVMVRSSDEGKSWTPPKTVINTPDDDRDPCITQLRDGKILISFFVYDGRAKNANERPPTRVHVVESLDGKTFSAPKPIDIGWKWDATSDEILELKDGTLLMPIYGRQYNDVKDRAAAAFSRDGGKTWNAAPPVTIAYDETGKMDFQEPAFVLLPDGTIRCSLRTTNAGYHAYESVSHDGGKTWSRAEDTGLRGHAAGLLYHSSGTIFHAYRSWSEEGSVLGTAGVFTKPNAKWDPKKEFFIMRVGGDCAYPSAVELKDKSILCVYYSRDHRAIEAAVLTTEVIRELNK